MNAAAPHGVKTNQRGTKPNVYCACAATIRSGISEPTTITTGSRAEHGKFIVAAPAGHEDCQLRGRSHGKEKEYATVNGKRGHVPPIRNYAQSEDRHSGDEDRREEVDNLISPRRDDIFLDQHFDAVSDWLEKAERPHAIRSIAVLHPCENFSLQHRYEREEREKHGEQSENINQTRYDLDQPARRMRHRCKQRLLSANKYLIKESRHLC